MTHRKYPLALLARLLVLQAPPGLRVATRRRFPLSRISYMLVFIFMCLHTIGAHCTYAEVPYEAWHAG